MRGKKSAGFQCVSFLNLSYNVKYPDTSFLACQIRMKSTFLLLGLVLVASSISGAEPCVSGPQTGQRPGPYSFLVASGPQRGQQTCYVCETAEKPGVIVFARALSEPLTKILVKCDDAVIAQPKDAMKAWATILGEKTVSLEALGKWTKQAGLKNVPTGIFDDEVGPPSYRLAADAEVTVLLFVDKKVVANFAFRTGEVNEEALKKISTALKNLTSKK